jgi:threonine dehydratase
MNPAAPALLPPTLADIRVAHDRIRAHVHRTPVMSSTLLNAEFGARLFFKCENLQKAGAFKARGACNAIFSLSDDEARRGVATHSSGNHAAALARAAGLRGIPAHIVMPSNAPLSKQRAVQGYGGKIIFCAPNMAARESTCAQVIRETGATLVHPYNDYRVIAGQGTATVELLEEHPQLDFLLAPVGGGGLLAGTAIAAKGLAPRLRVVGVEPAQADDVARSLQAGRIVATTPNTVADGLRTAVGELNFPLLQQHVDEVVTVSEAAIIHAMRRIWEALKLVVEPSAAVPLAALLERRISAADRRVGIILSGGNVDLDALPWSAKS